MIFKTQFFRVRRTLLPFYSVILLVYMQSCKKYEDGPGFTLVSPESRLQGSWVLTAGTWYDASVGDSMENIVWVEAFTEDHDYLLTKGWTIDSASYNYTIDGTWEWINDKDKIMITEDDGDTSSIAISKLTKSEFTYIDTSGYTYELSKLK